MSLLEASIILVRVLAIAALLCWALPWLTDRRDAPGGGERHPSRRPTRPRRLATLPFPTRTPGRCGCADTVIGDLRAHAGAGGTPPPGPRPPA